MQLNGSQSSTNAVGDCKMKAQVGRFIQSDIGRSILGLDICAIYVARSNIGNLLAGLRSVAVIVSIPTSGMLANIKQRLETPHGAIEWLLLVTPC